MKKIIALLLCLMFVLSITSCGTNSNAPAGMKLASNVDLVDYRLYVPDAWTVDNSTGITSAYYSTVDKSNLSVMSADPGESKSLEEYWDKYFEDIKATYSSVELLAQSDTLLGGSAASQYSYTAGIGGETYKFLQVLTGYNSRVYIFTFTATPEYYENHINEVKLVIDSFAFGK